MSTPGHDSRQRSKSPGSMPTNVPNLRSALRRKRIRPLPNRFFSAIVVSSSLLALHLCCFPVLLFRIPRGLPRGRTTPMEVGVLRRLGQIRPAPQAFTRAREAIGRHLNTSPGTPQLSVCVSSTAPLVLTRQQSITRGVWSADLIWPSRYGLNCLRGNGTPEPAMSLLSLISQWPAFADSVNASIAQDAQ